jgi:hypothetical protein
VALGVGDAARGLSAVATGGGLFEERLAHLRAAGVVQADEQDLGHKRKRLSESRLSMTVSVSLTTVY